MNFFEKSYCFSHCRNWHEYLINEKPFVTTFSGNVTPTLHFLVNILREKIRHICKVEEEKARQPVENFRHRGKLALLLLPGEVDQPSLAHRLATAELAKIDSSAWQT